MYWRAFRAGLFLVLCPPLGIWLVCRVFRPAPRPGEATESASRRLAATLVAPGAIAEPRRPREREPWTRPSDYVLPCDRGPVVRLPSIRDGIWDKKVQQRREYD